MVKDYLKAIRIGNLFLLCLLFWGFKGLLISSSIFVVELDFILLFAAIVFTAASGYLINDYYDVNLNALILTVEVPVE